MQKPPAAPHTQKVDAVAFTAALATALDAEYPQDEVPRIAGILRAATARFMDQHAEPVEATATDRMQSRRRGRGAKRRKPAERRETVLLRGLTVAVEQINEVAGDHTFGRAYRALAAKFERWPPERRRFIDAVLATPAAERSLGDDVGLVLLEMTTALLITEDIATLGVADGWARRSLDAFRNPAMAGAYPPPLHQRYPFPRYPAMEPRVNRLCELLLAIPDDVLVRMAKCPRRYADRPCGRYFVDNSPTAGHHRKQYCSGACKKAASLARGNGISDQGGK